MWLLNQGYSHHKGTNMAYLRETTSELEAMLVDRKDELQYLNDIDSSAVSDECRLADQRQVLADIHRIGNELDSRATEEIGITRYRNPYYDYVAQQWRMDCENCGEDAATKAFYDEGDQTPVKDRLELCPDCFSARTEWMELKV